MSMTIKMMTRNEILDLQTEGVRYLDTSDLPQRWLRISTKEAQKRTEKGLPVLGRYLGSYSTPRGGGRIISGYCYSAGDDVRSNGTWDRYAAPLTRAVFGGSSGHYGYFKPSSLCGEVVRIVCSFILTAKRWWQYGKLRKLLLRYN